MNYDLPVAENGNIKLFLGGDVMTGRGIDQRLPRSVNPVLYELYTDNAEHYVQLAEQHSGTLPRTLSGDYIWGDALKELERMSPDVRIINLETAATLHDRPSPHKRIHYRMHPENVCVMDAAGIDVCILANNHIMDWGQSGLLETLQALKAHRPRVAGAGADAEQAVIPAVIETESGRLLIYAWAHISSGTPPDWKAGENRSGVNILEDLGRSGADKVIGEVESFRKPDDRVVISLHWGGNWGYEVPAEQQKFARRLVDAGAADLIYGHSSHHPKGIEVYKDRLILYGCGDLINDYEGIGGYEAYRDDLPLMYFPELSADGALTTLRMSPMYIRKFRLHYASQRDANWRVQSLNDACRPFGTFIERTGKGDLELGW